MNIIRGPGAAREDGAGATRVDDDRHSRREMIMRLRRQLSNGNVIHKELDYWGLGEGKFPLIELDGF